MSARLEHITAEPDKRDFSDVSTAKLLELELRTRAELAREFSKDSVRSEQELRDAKASRMAMAPELWAGAIPRCYVRLKKTATDENDHGTLVN